MLKSTYHGIMKKYSKICLGMEFVLKSRYVLEDIIPNDKEYILFLTHDLGGGTRAFENQLIENLENVIILRNIGYGGDNEKYYRVESRSQAANFLLKKEDLLPFFLRYRFKSIIVNSLVNNWNWETIIRKVLFYKERNVDCKIMYFVHDFHAICENFTLFVNGYYCGLQCLKKKCNLHLGEDRIYIEKWRQVWGDFLYKADEVRCFSNSSKDIMLHVYPELKNVTVVPHDMSYCHFKQIHNIDSLPLKIGVIGATFSEYKGKAIVNELIKRYGNDIPITLIGNSWWRTKLSASKLKYIGKYKREELKKIVEQERISLVVFPSLWPETFSYVISEVMQMGVPIICFDIGAQGEKVEKYEKGKLCNNIEDLFDYIETIRKVKA